jgi:hypothetical protein
MLRTMLANKLVGYVWKRLKSRFAPQQSDELLQKLDELEDRIEYLEKREDKREEKRRSKLLS